MSAGVRWRRARAALLALAVAVVAPVAMGVGHAKQVPGGRAGVPAVARPVGPGVWVTLVTGDRVLVSSGRPATVRPGAGREQVRFHQFTERGDRYVLPTDAAVLVARGRLDRRLFDVSKLVQFGYDDRSRSDLPLLVEGAGGGSARSAASVVTGAARVTRELPRVGAVALREDKAAAGKFWERVRGGGPAGRAASGLAGGLQRVWLDGPVRAALDQSVPQIGAPAAWRAGRTGAGVSVGVLDTGVDATHPDLADAVDFTDSPSGTRDLIGHGTHVASIITGSGAVSAGRYQGVAPDARLLVGKVLGDDGFGSESWVLAGMEWSAGRTRVVNMSLGDPWPSDGTDVLSQAVNRLTAQSGTLFVVAAGNTGPSAESIGSPAAADAALTVGAVSKQDELAAFSSRGPRWMDQAIKPDLTAPGVDIVAARATGTGIGAPVGDGYTRLSGTSMATPHVAGAAAILAGMHSDWTANRLKAALMGSATPTAGPSVYEQGAGRVDVARATTQAVTATPASLSEGVVRWPHDDDQPIAKTISYHNDGDSDTTLSLGLDVRDPAGEPAPLGMFSLNSPQITVPAHGMATATVTTDTTVSGPDGLYGGVLTAASADGQTRLRIPIGVTREVESYNLTLSFLDHHGLPTPEYFFRFVDLKRPQAYLSYDPSGTVVARVPRGRYFLDGWIQTFNQDESIDTTLVTEPQVEVSTDAAMTVDARDGRPVGLLVDQPAARPGFTLLDFAMTTTWGGTGSFWAQPAPSVQATRRRSGGTQPSSAPPSRTEPTSRPTGLAGSATSCGSTCHCSPTRLPTTSATPRPIPATPCCTATASGSAGAAGQAMVGSPCQPGRRPTGWRPRRPEACRCCRPGSAPLGRSSPTPSPARTHSQSAAGGAVRARAGRPQPRPSRQRVHLPRLRAAQRHPDRNRRRACRAGLLRRRADVDIRAADRVR